MFLMNQEYQVKIKSLLFKGVFMAVSQVTELFLADIEKVWNIVTDVHHYDWRSDLSRTEVMNDKQFIEYTKDLYPTIFTITVFEPYQRYEFKMENSRMIGYWTGLFNHKDGFTTINFTEDVTPKKTYMKPFVKGYLKKQQQTYIHDLKKVLETL